MTAFEADFADRLELTPEAQDLLFREARTANTFTDVPVSDEQVRAIYDLVKWGPTMMNNQPLRIVLVRSPEARARLVEHMGGTESRRPLSHRWSRSWPPTPTSTTSSPRRSRTRRVPATCSPVTRDDVKAWARMNAALQVAYFIVGVRAAGLAAGPMTGMDSDAIDREFFPDGAHRTMAVVNIGHPGEQAWMARLPRLDYDEVVSTVC